MNFDCKPSQAHAGGRAKSWEVKKSIKKTQFLYRGGGLESFLFKKGLKGKLYSETDVLSSKNSPDIRPVIDGFQTDLYWIVVHLKASPPLLLPDTSRGGAEFKQFVLGDRVWSQQRQESRAMVTCHWEGAEMEKHDLVSEITKQGSIHVGLYIVNSSLHLP